MIPDAFDRATSFTRDQRGTITILGAVILPVVMGVATLGVEFGYALLVKSKNQQVADLAAYAGATAYNSTQSTISMDAAIANVAALNGRPGAATGVIVNSPRGNGRQAVQVTVATQQPIFLAAVLGFAPSVRVASPAVAELAAAAPACVIALKGAGTGVTLSGGVAVSTTDCGVASNATVSVPCGTTITTKNLSYNSTAAPSQPCNGIRPPSGTASVNIAKAATPDPLATDAAVTLAAARLTTVTSQTGPTAPAVANTTTLEFGWNQNSVNTALASTSCTAAWGSSSSTWTVTCKGDGPHTFGNVKLGGGITLRFNVAGLSTVTYNFGSIENSGTAIEFGPGTYNIARGLKTGGGSTTTFGGGTFNIGQWASSCNGAQYSICHTGTTLTFGGPSAFNLSAGLFVNGGSTITLGAGATNSYHFGASTAGDAMYMGGGAKTFLADATGDASLFRMNGNINVSSGGGSCLNIPAATHHDIKGSLNGAGGMILGSGVYTITGYVAFGGNGGGNVTCWGSSVGVQGAGVTLAIGASVTPSSGSCAGLSFCLAAGYSSSTLKAPTAGPYAKLLVAGPLGGSIAGASFTQGASNSAMSGAFYFPNGPIALSGGASLGSGPNECLQIIGSQITLTGGTALASACLGSSGSQSVVLVQ